MKKASYTVQARQENVSGVVLPAFEGVRGKESSGESSCLGVTPWFGVDEAVDFGLTGLSRGGQQVQKCRDTYVKAVGTLVELASLQVRFPHTPSCLFLLPPRSFPQSCSNHSAFLPTNSLTCNAPIDSFHHPRRSYPRHQPPSQRNRARHPSPSRQHHQIHQLGTGRDGSVCASQYPYSRDD